MSLLRRRYNMGVALACDAHGCARKFFPRSTRTHGQKALRERAALYGWGTLPSRAGDGSLSDICPDHKAVR